MLKTLLDNIARLILNPLIILGFTVATIYLFYAIVQMIWGADNSGDLDKKRKTVGWAILGLFIMFSVYGILYLVLDTFGIKYDGLF